MAKVRHETYTPATKNVHYKSGDSAKMKTVKTKAGKAEDAKKFKKQLRKISSDLGSKAAKKSPRMMAIFTALKKATGL